MAKTSKPKNRPVSEHSRAARRAVSPSLNLDKSLKEITTAEGLKTPKAAKPHVLASQSPGVRKNKGKPMKRQQRERHLKALERAADNLDKHELKVHKSIVKDKRVNERKKGWEDVNEEKRKRKNAFAALEDDEEDVEAKEREWVSDEEMPEVDVVESAPVKGKKAKEPVRVQGSIHQAAGEVEDEMI